ncbi:uncharacterized protein PHACADRAFT_206559 [Phanerochaete carnosa HHB-10118-sp]|uniref:DUF6533 domain-containing protein n=1 Tax=Phanerochaete carnosa (strain HHB-10118-sp) TaxID=650164 RepID=K5WF20_PHACS|nr:uncharacterized protein PHACADRAFT_206559 [Phanerochaete carnosa HHB-10118-sp]EKM57679.1 hypothetical protein PHACADRAFT_206559 [Phanerochaete carnosa HHB-10118-sp]
MPRELPHASTSFASHSTTHSVPSSALVVYEFLITISDEIDILWKRPVTVSAVLFGSVRWCMLITATLQLAPTTPNTAVFSALRVFAIWDRSRIWSLVVFALSMAPFIVNLVFTTMSRFMIVADPAFVAYITRSSLVLADTIVLVLTWIKTFGNWRRARSVNAQVSLATCLLRDGTIYFIALLAVNIAQILTYNSAIVTPAAEFVEILPQILIHRFMINLRTVDREVLNCSTHITNWQQEQSTIQFRRPTNRLGNIGETLQSGWDDDEPVDEEISLAELDGAGRGENSAEA